MKTVTRGLLAALVLLGSTQSTAAQSANDIIERRLVAGGGRAAFEHVTSARAFLGYEQAGMSVALAGQEKVGAEAPQVEDRAQRGRLDPRHVVPLIVVSMFLGFGVFIAVWLTWFDHRSRVKALDVLRVYAERNEEPPASVIQALTGIGPHLPQATPKPPATRGHHLAHVAANLVFALGACGIVWWKAPDPDNPGGLVIFAILAGLFFAAGAAARLVGAIYARE